MKLTVASTVIDVSPGYLRNYLAPRKLAQPATKGSLEEAERRREREAEAERRAAERAGETSALPPAIAKWSPEVRVLQLRSPQGLASRRLTESGFAPGNTTLAETISAELGWPPS